MSRPFIEKTNKPTDEKLAVAFAAAKEFYDDLKLVTANYRGTWSHYKTGGWTEKIADSKKALFYIIPLDTSFIVSMAIRESEHQAFLNSEEMKEYHTQLKTAKKYHEGFHMQFEITSSEDYKKAKYFILNVIEKR